MSLGIGSEGSASADRVGDEPAGSDATSSEDADGGLKAWERELRIPGVHDSQEAEHPAKPSLAFHAAMAKPEGDEETPGSRARDDRQAAKREGREAAHRGTDARASRLGELFPDGERRPGVQQDGLLRGAELAPLAVSAGRATTDEACSVHRRSATRNGLASIDGHGEIPGASYTSKIIVKPCAGKPQARFERGLYGTGLAAVAGTAP